MPSAIPKLIVSLSEIMFSVFETLHDEHLIAVREEPVLDLVLYQRNVTGCVNLFKKFKTARLRQEKE